MLEVKIRKGEEKDYPSVILLIKDLATFEKAPDKVTNSPEQMKQESNLFDFFVAENSKGDIVGFVLCFYAYYTWVGKSMYLDDLYVIPEYRRQKIGIKLMDEVFKLARKENCKRLRWQVIHWNVDAIEMYKVVRANIDNEWLNCDFDVDGIASFSIKE